MNKAINTAHAEALSLKAQIDALTEEYRAQAAILVTAGSGKHMTDHGSFTVSENNTYDEEVIMANLTKGQFMKVSERKLVKPLVKILYPKVYEAAKKRSETCPYKVSV